MPDPRDDHPEMQEYCIKGIGTDKCAEKSDSETIDLPSFVYK